MRRSEKRNKQAISTVTFQFQKGKIMAAYIKFDGIDGECQDKDHKAWSDLLSFNQAMHKAGGGQTSTARRRGDVVLEDIVVRKLVDKSSPKLAEAVCNGKVFPKVEIHVSATYTDSGRTTYYAYELKNVMVSSYQVEGNSSDDTPTDSFSLNFEEIKCTYTECDNAGKKKGNVEYNWKVSEGEK